MGEIEGVGVVGAGTMGSGIAHVFARSGFRVLLCDLEQRFLDRALTQIRTNLGREAAKGKLPEADVEPAIALSAPAAACDGPAKPTKSPVASIKAERPLALMFIWQSPHLPAPKAK